MSPRPILFLACTTLMLVGCKDREITAYRAPKDPAPAARPEMPNATNAAAGSMPSANAPADKSMASTAVPTASGESLTWTAPANWIAKPTGPMRKGSFSVKGDGIEADLSITAFPGSTGGLLANLNRWRGQLGIAPITDAEFDANTIHLDVGGLHLTVVDFSGTAAGKPTRILGAVVPHGSDTWFFKLMGPDTLVTHEKPAFLEFLNTIKSR